MAEDGKLGIEIRSTRKKYENLPMGIMTMVMAVEDLYETKPTEIPNVFSMMDHMCRLMIATYRETYKIDQSIAEAFLQSFVKDYPGVDESCLVPQLSTLMEAGVNYKDVATSQNRLMVWAQLKNLILAYNEFLNAFFGFLIPCLRLTKGKQPDPNVFNQSYSSKIEEMIKLTGGEKGAYWPFCRFADSKIRNAIGHGIIWLDANEQKVRFREGKKHRKESEINITDIFAKATFGLYLGKAYLAAIASLLVLIDGNEYAKTLLPQQVVRVYYGN